MMPLPVAILAGLMVAGVFVWIGLSIYALVRGEL